MILENLTSMQLEINKNLEKIINNIANNKDCSDFFNSKCDISKIFQSISAENIKTISREYDFHVQSMLNIFSNRFFLEKFSLLVQEERRLCQREDYISLSAGDKEKYWNNKLKNELQFICSALHLAFFVLSYIFVFLDETQTKNFRRAFEEVLADFKNKLNQKTKSDTKTSDICFYMYDAIRNFDNSYKENVSTRDFKINKMFLHHTYSRCIAEVLFLVVPQNKILSLGFKE